MAECFLRGLGVVPYAFLAVDAAYLYGGGLALWGFMVVMIAGSLLRMVLQWVSLDLSIAEARDIPTMVVSGMDVLLFPVVMCNAVAWPWSYVGATVLTMFVSLGSARLVRGSIVGLLVAVMSGLLSFTMAILLSSAMGLSPVAQAGSRWLSGWFAAIPAILLPVLSATRPIRWRPVGVYNAMTIECAFEIGCILVLFITSQVSGIHFATVEIERTSASDACRVLVYLGLLPVVLSTVVGNTPVDKKWVGMTQAILLELDVLCQGWSSLIALPLLSLSPFVAFPVVALLIRASRIFSVYKGF